MKGPRLVDKKDVLRVASLVAEREYRLGKWLVALMGK